MEQKPPFEIDGDTLKRISDYFDAHPDGIKQYGEDKLASKEVKQFSGEDKRGESL